MKNNDIGCLAFIAALVALVVVSVGWSFDATWAIKLVYIVYDKVDWGHVIVQKQPHDCEFTTAPLGEKNCHFEKIVTKIEWATNPSGQPIKSIDSGQSWFVLIPGRCLQDESLLCPDPYDPPNDVAPQHITVTGVIVEWKKVED